jgi:hypothetical protein
MAHDFESLKDYLTALGTQSVPHNHSDFLSHLVGVYLYLRRWNCPEHVVLAGLFHSIYGTHAFQDFSLPLSCRDEIRKLIGAPAERLAYIYCALTGESFRASVTEGGVARLWDRFADCRMEVAGQEFEGLLWVEFANIIEQDERVMNGESNGSLKYSPFWQAVAERLGGAAVESCREVYGSDSVRRNCPDI